MQGLVKLVVVQCSLLHQEFILANGKIEFIFQHISFHYIKLRLLVSVMWMFMCINFHISFHCLSTFTCLFCLFFLCVLERGFYLVLFICFLYLISKLVIAFFSQQIWCQLPERGHSIISGFFLLSMGEALIKTRNVCFSRVSEAALQCDCAQNPCLLN